MILTALIAASVMLADVTPAAATATATPAVAAPAAVASAAAPAEKPAEGRLVCHSEAQPGTLMTKKTCYRVAPKPTTDAKAAEPKAAQPAPGN